MAFSMAVVSISATSCPGSSQRGKAVSGFHRRTSVSYPNFRRSNTSRLQVLCAAKPETVDKVCAIVKKQLALGDDQVLNGESKFSALGADSLDTVEIVMGLEEEFGISVEEESAQNISTVQDAADLIDKLCAQKE